jgi:hypothetical protein
MMRDSLEERQMNEIDVEVDHVEIGDPIAQRVEHREVCGQVGFQRSGIEANRLIAHRHKLRRGSGVGARKQGDIMAELDQCVGQVRDHPLRATVKPGRDRFVQGRDLGNSHRLRIRAEERKARRSKLSLRSPFNTIDRSLRRRFAAIGGGPFPGCWPEFG